jgi:alkanesulfonate monooxygenase SsuD/methylene tetrahydromethanopterin reductase-like flavin-dependent oxidoreductase (luciferase family)
VIPFTIGLTDHLEGPIDRPSVAIFEEVADLVRLADRLGVGYAWFAEHHAHAHLGHMPTPLLLALHLAGQTTAIRLGTAITCLNLHHPLDVAEQVAVADALTGGRMAIGFGSGSTPEEASMFGTSGAVEEDRHADFEGRLRLILGSWGGDGAGIGSEASLVPGGRILPIPSADLPGRCWQAVNSEGSARVAGRLGFNVLFSHLRTPEQYRKYVETYRQAGGDGLIAANRPVFVGPDDGSAFELAGPALRTLWRRFLAEGKIPADTPEPDQPAALCGHPINFLVGGPQSVARQLLALHEEVPFDVANVEVRWAGLSHELVLDSLRRLMEDVVPDLRAR